jgi:hypothetical protein
VTAVLDVRGGAFSLLAPARRPPRDARSRTPGLDRLVPGCGDAPPVD